jgi:hypothetical protein
MLSARSLVGKKVVKLTEESTLLSAAAIKGPEETPSSTSKSQLMPVEPWTDLSGFFSV